MLAGLLTKARKLVGIGRDRRAKVDVRVDCFICAKCAHAGRAVGKCQLGQQRFISRRSPLHVCVDRALSRRRGAAACGKARSARRGSMAIMSRGTLMRSLRLVGRLASCWRSALRGKAGEICLVTIGLGDDAGTGGLLLAGRCCPLRHRLRGRWRHRWCPSPLPAS